MKRFIQVCAMAAMFGAAAALPAQTSRDEVVVQTWMLKHMSPESAAKLIAPYVEVSARTGVFTAGEIRSITVRGYPGMMSRIDSLIKANDKAPLSVRLRFQVIAALDSSISDPALSAVEAELRNVLRFNGYRLVAQGVVTTSDGSSSDLTLPNDDYEPFMVRTLTAAVEGAERGTIRLNVSLQGPPWSMDNKSHRSGSQILETGLTIPFGQSVVVGSGAAATISGRGTFARARALLLVVRADPIVSKP